MAAGIIADLLTSLLVSDAGCFKTVPAQRTGSDRKDTKTAIHGMLGPRRPGAGRFPLLTRFPAC